MDCLQATETISAAHDGPVPADALAEAQAHCRICSECSAFRDIVERIDRVPAPRAPDELVERLLAIAGQAASERRPEDAVEPPVPSAATATTSPSRARGRFARLTPRLAAYAAAAAVLLVALGVTTATLLGPGGVRDASVKDGAGLLGEQSTSAPVAPKSAPGERAGTADFGAQAQGPAYVALGSGVWRFSGSVEATPSALTTAGVITSDLGESSGPAEFTAFSSYGSPGTLYVRAADGEYLAFVRVTRTLGRRPYQLTTASPLLRFGEWPTLPERFPAPTSSDGAPAFRFFATDDLGVKVYVPLAGGPDDGIAVPPGTPPDDPAAGNPGWTWWEPVAP